MHVRNREEGEPPIENPGPWFPTLSTPEGLPKYSGTAGPLDVTAPSYPLLNFKLGTEEQPGGGGFLRTRRLSHARDRHLWAPGVPCAPKMPRSSSPCRIPSPLPLLRAGRSVGRRVRMRGSRPRGCPAPPPPEKAVVRSLRQPREIPLPPGAGLSGPQALGSRRVPPPAPGSRSLDGRRRVIRSTRIKGVGRCEPQTRGGQEGGGGLGGGQGTGGPSGRGLTGGLTDCGGFWSGRLERSGTAR